MKNNIEKIDEIMTKIEQYVKLNNIDLKHGVIILVFIIELEILVI